MLYGTIAPLLFVALLVTTVAIWCGLICQAIFDMMNEGLPFLCVKWNPRFGDNFFTEKSYVESWYKMEFNAFNPFFTGIFFSVGEACE